MGVLSDRILVHPKDFNKPTSDFYIHEHKKHKPLTGEVIEVGPDVQGVKVGDMIQFGPSAGSAIPMNGESWLILRQVEVDYVF